MSKNIAKEIITQEVEVMEVETTTPEVDPFGEYGPTIVQVKKINMPKTVKTGVGARCLELILTGEYTSKEIVEVVNKENPLRKTTYACVAWYKNDAKKKGLI